MLLAEAHGPFSITDEKEPHPSWIVALAAQFNSRNAVTVYAGSIATKRPMNQAPAQGTGPHGRGRTRNNPFPCTEGRAEHGGPRREPGDGRQPPWRPDELTQRDGDEHTGHEGSDARSPREHPWVHAQTFRNKSPCPRVIAAHLLQGAPALPGRLTAGSSSGRVNSPPHSCRGTTHDFVERQRLHEATGDVQGLVETVVDVQRLDGIDGRRSHSVQSDALEIP